MKRFLFCAAAGGLLVGCASTETGSVYRAPDGTPVYGLQEQPQSQIAGSGTLMPGAYDSGDMATGQFTGQERTVVNIGQQPVTPREADPRAFARTPEPGEGAGTLGQTGIQPGRPVSTDTIFSSSASPGLAPAAGAINPPTISSAPTIAEPLTRGTAENQGTLGGISGVGSAAGSESATSTDVEWRNLPDRNEMREHAPIPQPRGAFTTEVTDLPLRIREALTTGRPGTITSLTPDRVEKFEIDAVNGNVTLRGDVRSETERLMIGNRISRMEGVRSLNNQLRVVGPGNPSGSPVETDLPPTLQP